MVTIKKRIIDAVYRHAISAYPSECCGIITGKKGIPASLENSFPCRNLQDEMHASDPQKFPRTSKTAYFLDPKDLLNIEKVARTKDEVIRIIYHSHVDVGSYFSDEDKKQATFDGSPLMPDVNYLVVDVTKDSADSEADRFAADAVPDSVRVRGKARGAKLFGWDSTKKDFLELAWQLT